MLHSYAFLHVDTHVHFCQIDFCLVVWQVPVKHFKKQETAFHRGSVCHVMFLPALHEQFSSSTSSLTLDMVILSHQERSVAVSHDFSLHFPND